MKYPSFEEVAAFWPLIRAARRAARGKRHTASASRFMTNLESEVLRLEAELLAQEYRPAPYRTFTIYEPKRRTISAAAFRDRVVHHALCTTIEPMFERYAIFDSYACRPHKGGLRALHRLQTFARRYRYVLRLDISKFFFTVPHDHLLERLYRRIWDPGLRWLLEVFVRMPSPGAAPGRGLPIGNLTSQHFANFYLGALDHFIKEDLRIPGYVRYMDDEALLAPDKATLWRAEARIRAFLSAELGLTLKPAGTRLLPVSEGVPFLGFLVWPGVIRMDGAHARRFRKRFRALYRKVADGRLTEDEAVAHASGLLGWAAHADTRGFRQQFFRTMEDTIE